MWTAAPFGESFLCSTAALLGSVGFLTNRELAAHLYLSENTIKTQLRSLFAKLDVNNRVQAITVAQAGILRKSRGHDGGAMTGGRRRITKHPIG